MFTAGCCARARTDKMWLSDQVTRVQAVIRTWLQKRLYAARLTVEHGAAVNIQAVWRGYLVCLAISHFVLHLGDVKRECQSAV